MKNVEGECMVDIKMREPPPCILMESVGNNNKICTIHVP